MLVATVLISIMYLGLTYSLAEMSPALPHTGGAYSFARTAMGPWAGFLFGWAQLAVIITASIGAMAFVFGRYAAAFMSVPSDQLRQALEASPDA